MPPNTNELNEALNELRGAITELKVNQASFQAQIVALNNQMDTVSDTVTDIHKTLLAERCAETTWLRKTVMVLLYVALTVGGVVGGAKVLNAYDTPAPQQQQ